MISTLRHVPAVKRNVVSLENWRLAPNSSWAFQNVQEIVPSVFIRGNNEGEPSLTNLNLIADLLVNGLDGTAVGLELFLTQSYTDAFVVMKRGEVVAEWYAPTCDPLKPHIVFSISKSILGLLAGVLVCEGVIAADDQIGSHLPEMGGSAYADATIRNLLDMQISMDFTEDYLDDADGYARYRRATAWNPPIAGEDAVDLKGFLCSIQKGTHAHGVVHAYRSPNTDLAGMLLERASGRRLNELLSDLLWKPAGAYSDAMMTVDCVGAARAAGGISTTARDLARIDKLVRTNGGNVVPQGWIDDLWTGGNNEIWKAGDQASRFPQGSYRSYWYSSGRGELAAIGIHGQWMWIDPAREVVLVKQSSQPLPTDETIGTPTIAMLRKVVKSI
jgi:CubicO group peptidase (beta-lactamase class C family)